MVAPEGVGVGGGPSRWPAAEEVRGSGWRQGGRLAWGCGCSLWGVRSRGRVDFATSRDYGAKAAGVLRIGIVWDADRHAVSVCARNRGDVDGWLRLHQIDSSATTLFLDIVRKKVVEISGRDETEVRVVACPYRICPLGAHIDHQGGIVTAMTINYGVLLGFVPSNDSEVLLQSGQFKGVIQFRVDDLQKPIDNPENINWESYARGAVYALQKSGYDLRKGIIGYISGVKGLDSSGLSSSAAVGIAYLLALENVNDLAISPVDNIQLDKSIENKYLGLENGILDPSAILLSRYGYLTFMDCKTATPSHVYFSELSKSQQPQGELPFKILLAFSGLQHNLPKKRGYNTRVFECKEAARALLHTAGCEDVPNILRNVDPVVYETQKGVLEENLSRRAEHYFSEMKRVAKGRDAWARGHLQELGQLISASGRSSILNYECGSKEMIQLYEILLKAPGVLGARFSGAGFRGCCLAIVESDRAEEAAAYVAAEYEKAQPELVSRIPADRRVLVCEPGDAARVVVLPDDDRLRS